MGILKLWFEIYFQKENLSEKYFCRILPPVIVFGNKILSPANTVFKVEDSWTLAPHQSNDRQPDLVGSNVCTKQET